MEETDPYVMVDGPSPSEGAHIFNHFFYNLPEKSYSSTSINKIHSRRSHPDLQGRLYYDELLSLALVSKNDENELMDDRSYFYPPNVDDTDSIIELIQLIQDSSFDRIKKMALWYYLMLDLDQLADGENAVQLAKEMGLPRSARYAMTGYWLLDRGDYPEAVSYLTEQPDFVSKILHTISPLRYTSTSRVESSMRAIALSQFLSLVDIQDLGFEPDDEFEEANIVATCWNQGIRAAWVQCQGLQTSDWNEEQELRRIHQIGRILEFCFMPDPQPDAIKALLALPLKDSDEELLCHTIINPPSGIHFSSYSHAVALDVLLVRRINSGQYYDAILLDRRINATIGLPHLSRGGSSDKELEKLRHLRTKREGLVRSALSVLTSVERQLLNIGEEEEEERSAEMETTSVDRQDLEMSWERVGDSSRAEQRTPLKGRVTTSSRNLTPLSASSAIRKEKGNETASESFLSAVVRSSPKRNKITEFPRSGTASPLSRSLMQRSPSFSRSASLRQTLDSPKRTSRRSLLVQKDSPAGNSSPFSSGRPYELPQQVTSMRNEEAQQSTDVVESADDAAGDLTVGPYARLAEQLQEQMDQNNGDISVDRILQTKSPFRSRHSSAQLTKQARQSSTSFSRPVHRYKATYEIGNASGEGQEVDEAQQNPQISQDGDLNMEEIPKRRGGRTVRKTRAKDTTSKVLEQEAQDDASLPGSFPGDHAEEDGEEEGEKETTRKARKSRASATPVKRRTTRRNTRLQSITRDEEDEVPEMPATPTMKRSKSAAATLSRTRSTSKLASTPVRRSARLSVEPESATPQLESMSPVRKGRSRRAASKGPSLASASEKEETENEKEQETGMTTRSRRSSKMPGTF